MSVRFESNNHIIFKFWNEAGEFLYKIMRGRPQDSIQEYWEEGNPVIGEDKYIADLVDKISKAISPNFPPYSEENPPLRPQPTDVIFTIDEIKELKEKNEIIQRNQRYHTLKNSISDLLALIEGKLRNNARTNKEIRRIYENMTGQSGQSGHGPASLIRKFYGINVPNGGRRTRRTKRVHNTRKNRKSSRRNSPLKIKN